MLDCLLCWLQAGPCPPRLQPDLRRTQQLLALLTFLCCSCSLHGSLAGLSSQSPPAAAPAPPLPSAVTCTRAAD